MTGTTIPCPDCPAYLAAVLVDLDREMLACWACGHVEPLPASYEVARAGTSPLPGLEDVR